MQYFDVFNGDADGICALHQLRLACPRDATLVTGVKRDIDLLRQVPAVPGGSVTVLDVSLDNNREALLALLTCGMQVAYFDHHFPGEIPLHARLQTHIDTSGQVCTSMLVDGHLGGAYRVWAVVGAFGDNLGDSARQLARSLGLAAGPIAALQELGENLNYNAYGDSEADLFVHPAVLYRSLHRFADPQQFIACEPLLQDIRAGRREDLAQARCTRPLATFAGGRVFVLPDAAWSRRVRGAWGNELARAAPECAHAVLTLDAQGAYVASVRAPLTARRDADRLCREFPGGGGRAAAAGINGLPQERLAEFLHAFERIFGQLRAR
jgi:single-stranded DNA-specific DHH superfamily exonuclease